MTTSNVGQICILWVYANERFFSLLTCKCQCYCVKLLGLKCIPMQKQFGLLIYLHLCYFKKFPVPWSSITYSCMENAGQGFHWTPSLECDLDHSVPAGWLRALAEDVPSLAAPPALGIHPREQEPSPCLNPTGRLWYCHSLRTSLPHSCWSFPPQAPVLSLAGINPARKNPHPFPALGCTQPSSRAWPRVILLPAGSKALEYSNGIFDCQSPTSPFMGSLRALHLVEDLRGLLEMMEADEREGLRCQVPDSTAEALIEWLQSQMVQSHLVLPLSGSFGVLARLALFHTGIYKA